MSVFYKQVKRLFDIESFLHTYKNSLVVNVISLFVIVAVKQIFYNYQFCTHSSKNNLGLVFANAIEFQKNSLQNI